MSPRLDIPLEDMDDLARRLDDMVKLGSFCTVFSATEVLENIRHGKKVEDIVKGLFYSVIKRVLEMDSMTEKVVMTGGVVAHNPYLVEMAEELIGQNDPGAGIPAAHRGHRGGAVRHGDRKQQKGKDAPLEAQQIADEMGLVSTEGRWPREITTGGSCMSEEKKVVRKKIEATGQMHKIMADYFYELDAAAKTGEKKIAWCTSVGPAEILRALGFLVYFPENHGAMLGATRMATDFIPEANAIGYSPEICSYLTADVGAYLQGHHPAVQGLQGHRAVPKPDVLVYNTNQCRDVQDWFAWYADEFDVPLLGVHTHRGVGDVTEAHVMSIARQMEALIPPAGGDRRQKVRHGRAQARRWRCPGNARSSGKRCWTRPRPSRRPSPSLTAPSTWDRPWCCAAPRRRSITTKSCWPNWKSGSPTAWAPWRTRSSASTGKACRSGAG